MSEMKKLFIPIFFGFVAGFISFLVCKEPKKDPVGIFIFLFMFYVCKYTFRKLKIKVEGRSALESFFTLLISWYFSWTLFLNILLI